MKKLILIGGTMGVGKSAVSKILLERLQPSGFLDGDWCWMRNPFTVTEEDKEMVLSNIADLLRRFLNHSTLEYVVFCWVMHQDEIVKDLLNRLSGCSYELYRFNLTCGKDELKKRLERDVKAGIREAEVIERSAARLPLYSKLGGILLDTGSLTAEEAADKICGMLK